MSNFALCFNGEISKTILKLFQNTHLNSATMYMYLYFVSIKLCTRNFLGNILTRTERGHSDKVSHRLFDDNTCRRIFFVRPTLNNKCGYTFKVSLQDSTLEFPQRTFL